MQPHLPIEILCQIASWLALIARPEQVSFREDERFTSDVSSLLCKPNWTTMDALSRSSKELRRIALMEWFRIIHVRKVEDWTVLQSEYPFVQATTKYAHCLHEKNHSLTCARGLVWMNPGDEDLDNASVALLHYPNVRTVGIYLPRVTSDEDQPNIEHVFGILPRKLESLEVFYALYPDFRFVQAIANAFPELRTLRLAQPAIWCNGCYTCNVPVIECPAIESIPSITYNNGSGLPVRIRCIQ